MGLEYKIAFLLFWICMLTSNKCYAQSVEKLDDSTWGKMMTGEWMVKFYAPWCPACRSAEKPWHDFAKMWSDELDIKVGDVDITISAGLSGRFMITSLPTIVHVKDGDLRIFKGARSVENLVKFVQDKQWEDIEPVPWYQHPSSPHMAMLGYAFQFSLQIRNLHDYITETHGLPVWVSYVAFAVATIFSAIVIGLLLVVLLERCCPASSPARPLPDSPADDLEDDMPEGDSVQGNGDSQAAAQDVRRRKAMRQD